MSGVAIWALAKRFPWLLFRRSLGPVLAVAAVSAVGAVLADGAPTALSPVDVVLRGAFAAGLSLIAARAKRRAWVVASALTLAVSASADLEWPAFIAIGAALALANLNRRSWLVGATIGAGVAQVLLRLSLPGPTGTESLVALAFAAPLVVSGVRRLPTSTRRRVRRGALALAVLAIVAAAGALVAGLQARSDVMAAVDASRAGLAAAREGDDDEALALLDDAAAGFASSQDRLGAWWAQPALAVPLVAQQVRAADDLVDAGASATASAVKETEDADLDAVRLVDGVVNLEALAALDPALVTIAGSLDQARVALAGPASPWLLPPLVDAKRELAGEVVAASRDADRTLDAVRLTHDLLGGDGPRRYFLAVVTPAELRGSGGLLGNFGEITAVDGDLELVESEAVRLLNRASDPSARRSVIPPAYLDRYVGWDVDQFWQNVTVGPDFPTVAEVIESLYPLGGNPPVDGVISVDPIALAAILELTGPVEVAPWPEPITAENAIPILLHEHYVLLGEGQASDDFLSDVTDEVWDAFTSGALPGPAEIAEVLSPMLASRHIQLHSQDDLEQVVLDELDAGGALPPVRGDGLTLVNQNGGENKLDWFLRRSLDYEVRYDPADGTVAATATVTLTNGAPEDGLPSFVLGSRRAPPGHNRQIFAFYSPLEATEATIEGLPVPVRRERELGRNAYVLDVTVPAEGSLEVALELEGTLTGGGPWRLDLGRQPVAFPDDVAVRVEVPEGWEVAEAGSMETTRRTATWSGSVDADRTFEARFRPETP